MTKEMCSATYWAEQLPGVVVIHATGTHQSTGFRVSFERVGVTIFPPQFSFMHEAPRGSSRKSPTPFNHEISFETGRKVDAIVIYDARGRHVIDVVQKQETAEEPPKREP